jgi:uncharacterized protein
MPDEHTAYFGDDGEYTVLFMYVADKPRDLLAAPYMRRNLRKQAQKTAGPAS